MSATFAVDVEVVVAEGVVLGRVEDLQQGRGRVAAPVGADLVDLVQHDHRVQRAGLAQRAHEPPRKRPDVGAPVPADLGLVADAAQADARELPPQGPGDRVAERGLARAGRPDQGQDHAAAPLVQVALAPQLAHREVLDDALLHLLEPRVVGVEHLPRGRDVEPLLGARAPRQRHHPLQVGADHPGLGALGLALQARELALGLPAGGLGHAGGLDAGGPVVAAVAVLAQLAADRLQLSAQEHLALAALHALGHVLADAPAQAGVGQPLALGGDGLPQALDHVGGAQDVELRGQRDLGGVAHRVGQAAGVRDGGQEVRHARAVAAQLGDLLDDGAVLARQRRGLGAGVVGIGPLDGGHDEGRGPGGRTQLGAVGGLDRDPAGAVGQGDLAHDLRHGPPAREAAVHTRDEHDAPVARRGQGGGLLLRGHREGHAGAGEDDGVVEGEDGEGRGGALLAHAGSRDEVQESYGS